MKKILFNTLALFIASSSITTVNFNKQYGNKMYSNENKVTSNIIKKISNVFENNPDKKINYTAILKSIFDNGIYEKIKKDFNEFYYAADLIGFFGPSGIGPSTHSFNDQQINITSSNIKEINDNFEESLKDATINKFEFLILISVVSELAHYFSINNIIDKTTLSINIVKEIIQNIKKNYAYDLNGSFMKEIQSWNLTNIINNYNNKIFIDKLDFFRTIPFDSFNIKTANSFENMIINDMRQFDFSVNIMQRNKNYLSIIKQDINLIDNPIMQFSIIRSTNIKAEANYNNEWWPPSYAINTSDGEYEINLSFLN